MEKKPSTTLQPWTGKTGRELRFSIFGFYYSLNKNTTLLWTWVEGNDSLFIMEMINVLYIHFANVIVLEFALHWCWKFLQRCMSSTISQHQVFLFILHQNDFYSLVSSRSVTVWVTAQSVAGWLQAGQWPTDSFFLMISLLRHHVWQSVAVETLLQSCNLSFDYNELIMAKQAECLKFSIYCWTIWRHCLINFVWILI